MKQIMHTAILFLLFAYSLCAQVPAPYVQGGSMNIAPDSNWTQYGASYSYTFSAPATAPCTFVLASRFPLGTVTDSQGNTWAAVSSGYNSLAYSTTCYSGPVTVNVTYPSPGWFQVVFAEYAGRWVVDQVGIGAYEAYDHIFARSAGILPSEDGELILGIGQNHETNFPVVTPGFGFTLRGVANEHLQDMIQTKAAPIVSVVMYAVPTYTMEAVFSFKRQ